jgi:hypothetical protein
MYNRNRKKKFMCHGLPVFPEAAVAIKVRGTRLGNECYFFGATPHIHNRVRIIGVFVV